MKSRQNSFFNKQTAHEICEKLIKNDFPDVKARDAWLDQLCVSEDGRGLCFQASIKLHDKHVAEADADRRQLYISLVDAIDQARGRGRRADLKREIEEAKSMAFGI